MYYRLVLLSFIFIILQSCSKNCISINDIRQTDLQGNIHSSGSPKQWKATSDSAFFFKHINLNSVFGNPYTISGIPLRFCSNPTDSFTVELYPNPVVPGNGDTCTFRVTSNRKIIGVIFQGVDGWLDGQMPITPPAKTYNVSIGIFNSWAGYGGGPVFYAIVTEDSCTYVGYGMTLVKGAY